MNPVCKLLSAGTLGLCLAGYTARSAPADGSNTALTIYSSAEPGAIPPEYYRPIIGQEVANASAVPGYALVRQERKIDIAEGRSQLKFTDVAALMDPTTVQFTSLTDPEGTRVLDQNFQFDLVSTAKLLSKYVDKAVIAREDSGNQSTEVSGVLLSASDGLVLRGNDGQIHALRNFSSIRFAELPGGLITRPTLVWNLIAKRGGAHDARVSYQTGGMTWWADYNLVFTPGANANAGTLDVGAWVSIINQSGASFDHAKLKLIAGDVQRAGPPPPRVQQMMAADVRAKAAHEAFVEKTFFEYHLYTLGRSTTLANNSTQQIELFETAKRVPARKTLVYYGAEVPQYGATIATDREYGVSSSKKVDVYLEFKNDEKDGLGVPLPKGRIRVSQVDSADQSLEFIGEDVIDHTPKNERVLVKLGSAFDVVGERKQVDFAVDLRAHWLEEEIEVKIRNHKMQPVDVLVKENLYRGVNWSVKSSTRPFDKQDAHTIYFLLKLAPESEAGVRYRARYTW